MFEFSCLCVAFLCETIFVCVRLYVVYLKLVIIKNIQHFAPVLFRLPYPRRWQGPGGKICPKMELNPIIESVALTVI